jgi:hypothetical protein
MWIRNLLWERGYITIDESSSLERMKGYYEGDYSDEASIEIRKILSNLGFDGIIYKNTVEGNGTLSVMALYPEQIYTVAESKVAPNTRFALTGNETSIPDFEIASGSIDMIERKQSTTL